MISLAATLLRRPGTRVTLVYGNRRTSSVMFAEEIADLKDEHLDRFDVIHVLSREPREVDLFSGRIDAERLAIIVRDLLTPSASGSRGAGDDIDGWWLCGPFPLVELARTVLGELGVPRDRIHVEVFYVEDLAPAPARHLEPGTQGRTAVVSVILDGRTTSVDIPCGTTVLDGAQTERADLPFACKGGVCGTCRALVREGDVDMLRNYALEDDEVASGFVLTCQSVPVSDRVVLDYDA